MTIAMIMVVAVFVTTFARRFYKTDMLGAAAWGPISARLLLRVLRPGVRAALRVCVSGWLLRADCLGSGGIGERVTFPALAHDVAARGSAGRLCCIHRRRRPGCQFVGGGQGLARRAGGAR